MDILNNEVNAWTEWGRLETIVIGDCFNRLHYPHIIFEPYFCVDGFTYNKEKNEEITPEIMGPYKPDRIERASKELQNLCDILEGESVTVLPKKEFCSQRKKE